MTDTPSTPEPTPPPPAPEPPAPAPAPTPAEAQAEALAEEPAEKPKRPFWQPERRGRIGTLVIIVVAVAALLAVLSAFNLPPFGGDKESTDNAYVRGRTTVIAPQVAGYVVEVLVKDYQQVKAGQALVRIDDRIYRARVEQAQANLAAQKAALANSTQAHAARVAAVGAQSAGIASAEAQLRRARADMARADELVADGSISIRERDQTLAALRQAEAQLRQANATRVISQQDVRTVEVGRGGLAAQVEAAEAALRLAQVDLDNTVIRARESGQLGEVGVRLGQFVGTGTQLMSLVPADRWVIANFKEEQTAHIRAGQTAHFTVDALDGREFTGKVESLSPAAGSEFAVLKPDNATGNFVKVPQRLGVRIAVDPKAPGADLLRPGMSVQLSVATGR